SPYQKPPRAKSPSRQANKYAKKGKRDVAGMVRPSGSKAAHVTCNCPALGGLHDFDMQSSGGSAGALKVVVINGVLMSFLDALRSLTAQVPVGVRLIIEASVPLLINRADDRTSLRWA